MIPSGASLRARLAGSRLELYVAAVVVSGTVAGAGALAGPMSQPLEPGMGVTVLAVAVLCAAAFPVTIVRHRGSEEHDVSSAFTLAALLLFGPAAAVAIELFAVVCVEIAKRRVAIKAIFNVAQRTLSIAAAGVALHLTGGATVISTDGINMPGVAGFVAAITVYIAIDVFLVTVVCALAAREPVIAFVRREMSRSGLEEVPVVLLVPVVIALVVVDPLLIPLLVVPAWALRRSGQQGAASYHQARHDPLTGLPNRMKMDESLAGRFAESPHARGGFALVMTDLDRFREVNDALGPAKGDRLLVAVAARIAGYAGPDTVVARLQGDEFGILLDADAAAGMRFAEGLVEAFQAPLDVDGLAIEIGIAAGVATDDEDVEGIEEIHRRAHVAMRAAKRSAGGCAVYDRERDNSSPLRLTLIGDLRRAIHESEISPFFQAQVDLRSGEVVGAEALVRWSRPDGTLVPPMEFIPEAEASGLMRPLTLHMLAAALSTQRRWAADGMPLRVSVNLSARSLSDPDLVRDVRAALERAAVAPPVLELEVTESALMEDPDRALRTLRALASLGVRLAIDDFGTGYSSLAYLGRLPVHVVKIDRSFVRDLASDPTAELIVRSTINLGHALGLTVVAEGVEDETTCDRLRSLGCDTGQGFLWSPAIPADRFFPAIAALSKPVAAMAPPAALIAAQTPVVCLPGDGRPQSW